MPAALLLPILLRAIGPVAFIAAAITAGAMNRSFIVIPLLALAATATTILIRKISPSPARDLQKMMSPDAATEPPSIFRGIGRSFGLGLVGYAIVFGLSALIAALFQATDFEPQLRPGDTGFFLIPASIALIGAWLSTRIGLSQMTGMMDQMQDVFAQMQAQHQGPPDTDETFTVEGEVIEPDDRQS